MSIYVTDSTIDLIAEFLFKSNGDYGFKYLAKKDAEELVRYLTLNGVCLVEREGSKQ